MSCPYNVINCVMPSRKEASPHNATVKTDSCLDNMRVQWTLTWKLRRLCRPEGSFCPSSAVGIHRLRTDTHTHTYLKVVQESKVDRRINKALWPCLTTCNRYFTSSWGPWHKTKPTAPQIADGLPIKILCQILLRQSAIINKILHLYNSSTAPSRKKQ